MRGFRRAQLRGSEELFRSTDSEPEEEEQVEPSHPAPRVSLVPSAPEPGTHSVRLTDSEISMLADALQKLKYPKPMPRPSVDEFERFEDLRRKLLAVL
ncbi:MAG TPA: hypothetical protein VE219_04575 [Candidatus Sulfotelmatobacter sp.]|jgi:hypothetical protein|nr:hypothetical protein [Candidatus Sulfotelmatobacter sp.]